jgi:predicted nucleic acid-binding protein
MILYLDNCCFNRPFDRQDQIKIDLETEAKLFIQEKIREGYYKLLWSYILDYENSKNPFQERKITISKWNKYAFCNVSASEFILANAKKLNSELNIKAKDSLHIACAIEGNADVFLTTDIFLIKRLKKYPTIEVVNPLEFINTQDNIGELL